MAKAVFNQLNRNLLRRWLIVFFLALAIPTGFLIFHAYDQLKWEAFHQYRLLAEELSERIDSSYNTLIETEEQRSFSDYNFLVVTGDPSANYIQRSPLSEYPVNSAVPGLIGYFQVDADGIFTSPLIPESSYSAKDYGIQPEELNKRQLLSSQLRDILSENRLVRRKKVETPVAASIPARAQDDRELYSSIDSSRSTEAFADEIEAIEESDQLLKSGQGNFDSLSTLSPERKKIIRKDAKPLGKVIDLKLDKRYQEETIKKSLSPFSASKKEKRSSRKELSALPEQELELLMPAEIPQQKSELRIKTFESEIDPFEFSILDSGHLVLFRKVWRDDKRYIQGALIDQDDFLKKITNDNFQASTLAAMSDIIIAHQGNVLMSITGTLNSYPSGNETMRGSLLHQANLSAPLNDFELIFSINHLPAGPGATVISWISGILLLILCVGFIWMYRVGIKQILLANQQQDFVSAVSHELKTPLTSIRMYGEMLREGWAPDEKKKEYYEFIHDESERLSRLINNILQLSRMTRNDLEVDLKPVSLNEIMDSIQSKISSQVERSGFTLEIKFNPEDSTTIIHIDQDYFTQIIINLVDNALKFSANSDQKKIIISCDLQQDNKVVFKIRDFGSGIPKNQIKKIFKLFYRCENELTRETVGTGIGLALVNQLASYMDAKVDVMNKDHGAEFSLIFPIKK